jgi:hypothetical protein
MVDENFRSTVKSFDDGKVTKGLSDIGSVVFDEVLQASPSLPLMTSAQEPHMASRQE